MNRSLKDHQTGLILLAAGRHLFYFRSHPFGIHSLPEFF